MTKTKLSFLGVLIGGMMIMTSCSQMFSQDPSMPEKHPVDLKGKHAVCNECHDAGEAIKSIGKPYGTFNHNAQFYKDHSYYVFAGNDGELCAMCHVSSFCLDCHATNTAVRPTTKNEDNPEFEFNHRGDWRIRHRIDGEQDPAQCYKCHGRTNNAVCRECHRGGL